MGESTEGADRASDTADSLSTTARRRAITRAGAGIPAARRSRLATQGYVALGAALILSVIIASLAGSSWLSFNPVNGIAPFGGVALRPQGFGDSSTLPTTAPATPVGTVAAISGQTHPPTVPPTATSRTSSHGGGGVATGSYPASFTGTWSGGSGQGCPGGGAPAPRTNVIRGASDYGVGPTNMVALTFDDGPTPFSSPPIISFLEKSHTPATFFVLGQYAHAYPYLVQREAADGFAIGVHTWDHPDMQLLTVSQRANELGSTIQQLHTDLGAKFCIWLWRPPYGAVDSSIVRQADAFGLTTINWNVDPADWSRPGTMVIVQRVLSQVRPGSIILMHDGPAAREQTAAALPYILAGLHSRGLVPVTLPTLLLSGGYAGGPTATATPRPTATSAATATPTATPAAPTPTDTPAAPTPTNTPVVSLGGAFAWLGGAALPRLSVWRWWVIRPPGLSVG
ncbi:MAG TPA: polysaccharide deacetylase family protein [Ktedonobacterales bacterium]